jgi:hypothetical protein
MTGHEFQFLLFLTIFSYIVAAVIGAYQWFRLRRVLDDHDSRRLALVLVLLLMGLGVGGACEMIANAYRPINIYYPTKFVWWHWVGRAVKSIGTWSFVLYNIGFARRKNGSPAAPVIK